MAQVLLFEDSIAAGAALIAQLRRDGMPIEGAAWLKQDDRWQLVVVSPVYDQLGPLRIYGLVRVALRSAGLSSRLQLDDVTVVGHHHGEARDVIEVARGRPTHSPAGIGIVMRSDAIGYPAATAA